MYFLSIVTPDKIIFEGQVNSLIAPGTIGYLEILKDHAPIITSLRAGKLIITNEQNEKSLYAISGGFLEVYRNNATVLGDTIEAASDIDIKRAEAAAERARKMVEFPTSETDAIRAKNSLKRSENRIKIYHDFTKI